VAINKKKILKAKAKKPATQPGKTKPKATSTKRATSTKSSLQNFISPLQDRLVVSVSEPRTKTAGGIIIPGTVATQSNKGKVLAVGPGARTKKGQLRPPDVRVGDEVLYSEHAGTKLAVQGQEVLILREEEILGILTH
jgi:chaperonin GroES